MMEDSEMVKLYKLGMSSPKIAEKAECSVQKVCNVLNKEGVHIRKTKSECNETVFDVIDSEEKAYWLGFLAADGNVTDANQIQLELKREDEEHLKKFCKFVGLPVSRVKRYSETTSYLGFKSVRLANGLKNHGVTPRKTFSLKPPILDGNIQNHFWRGMVDGDGSIPASRRYGKSRTDVELVGTKEVCEGFTRFVESLGLNGSVSRAGSVWRASVSGSSGVKLLDVLYGDASIFLDRKYVLAQEKSDSMQDGVSVISHSVAGEFIVANHYLKSMPIGVTSYGWFVGGKLKGVGVIGNPSSAGVLKIFGKENRSKVAELRRFCIINSIKNESSKFLAKLIKKYFQDFEDKTAVVSYADDGVGHSGTIYKATNAVYYGSSCPELVAVLPNGERLTQGMVRNYKGSFPEGTKAELSAGKHKFIYFRDSKWEKECLWDEKSYV